MTITLTGTRLAPLWETTQQFIRDSLNDEEGRLVRIARKDGRCDYRAVGDYELDFRTSGDDIITVHLSVTS